jgi:hypothetical protein
VLQTPAFWHWPGAAQVTAVPPVHAPARQVSLCVQALLSLQAVPSGLFADEQVPVAGLHEPAVVHEPAAPQTMGFAPVQAPAWHVSVWVQPLPSSHDDPLALFV